MRKDDLPEAATHAITRVIAAFAKWREEPRRGRKMPDALWIMAFGLARSIGVGRTSTILGLNPTVLKHRLEEESERRLVKTGRPRFMEIGLAPAPGFDCRVELEQGGRRIGISLRGARPDDVAALVRRLEVAP